MHVWHRDCEQNVYSYFKKGCRVKCLRLSRKVLWVVLNHCFAKKFERMTREAMDVCLRVLNESSKRSFDSYFIMSDPILPFGIVACALFFDNLSLNSCIQKVTNRGI